MFPTLAAPQKEYLYANILPWQTKTGCFILEQTQIVVTSISDIGNFSKHKIFRNGNKVISSRFFKNIHEIFYPTQDISFAAQPQNVIV